MAQEKQEPKPQEPKQRTREGLEIPVPKREDVMRGLRKAARIPSGPRRPKK